MQEKDSTQKLGKSFGYIAWVLALAALTYFFAGIEERKDSPNQQLDTYQTQTYKEVILKDNRANHYIFTGKINQVDVVFLVDTGATDVAMPESLANKLNLAKGRVGIASTANGNTQFYETTINELKIGDITLNNIDASIVSGMESGDTVLLGMSALKNLEMIHSNGELKIRQYY